MLKNLQLSLQFGAFDHAADAAPHRAALPRHSVNRWIRHALQHDGEITVRVMSIDPVLAARYAYLSSKVDAFSSRASSAAADRGGATEWDIEP